VTNYVGSVVIEAKEIAPLPQGFDHCLKTNF